VCTLINFRVCVPLYQSTNLAHEACENIIAVK
jgi:hypothetical protein